MVPNDLAHTWGQDIEIDSSGDLRLVRSSDLTRERVIRRLLTSPGDYIWSLSYGAGLSRIIGTPVDTRAVEAMIRLQMRSEQSVQTSPPPVVKKAGDTRQNSDTLALSIQYVESGTNRPYDLVLDVMR